MREIKFRGWSTYNDKWVYGYLTVKYNTRSDEKHYFIYSESGLSGWRVDPESVGIHWIDDLYEGDIFVVDGLYPFFKDNHNNDLGAIDYIPLRGWAGWYYGMHCINDNLRGSACGGSLADLEDDDIRVIGNTYENPDLIRG